MLLRIARQGLEAIFLVLLVASVSFFLIQLTPGTPASVILGTSATPDAIAELNHKLGLDRPVLVQYAEYMGQLLRLDLGRSFLNNQPVGAVVMSRLPVTMSLALLAMLVSTTIGILVGTAAAIRGGRLDGTATFASGVGLALPSFWVAALLVLVLSLQLHWFPATGYVPPTKSVTEWLSHLVLPVAALSVVQVAAITRQTRTAVVVEAGRDYVRALLAAGVSRRSVVWKHLLRNASIPVVTTLGIQFVAVLGGAVVIEYFFALPGIGSLVVSAASTHDLPMVQGVVVASAIVVVIVNLVIDLLLRALSPTERRA